MAEDTTNSALDMTEEEGVVSPTTQDTATADPTETTQDTTTETTQEETTSALSDPYRAEADKMADQTTPEVTAGYKSPFTQDEQTGAISGQPQGLDYTAYTGESADPNITVAGQLESLLKKDSPLNQVVSANAREQASALGMGASSMAVGAAQRALIQESVPIATQDAKTMASFAKSEQDLAYQQVQIETEAQVAGELNLQKAQLAEQQTQINQRWETVMKGLDSDTQASLSKMQFEQNKEMETLTASLNKELYQQQVDATMAETLTNNAMETMNNYQITVQQLMGNQVFLESMPDDGGATMNQVFNDLFVTAKSSIVLSYKNAGLYTGTHKEAIDAMIEENMWGKAA